MSCAFAAATTTSTSTTKTSSCSPTKIINSTFSLHSNSIRQRTHFVKVPRSGVFKKKHAMRIPKRSIASLLSPFQLNFSLFISPCSFLFATRKLPICACGEGLFVFFTLFHYCYFKVCIFTLYLPSFLESLNFSYVIWDVLCVYLKIFCDGVFLFY